MRVNKVTIDQFVTSSKYMGAVAGTYTKPVIYEAEKINKIIQDFNDLMIVSHIPYEIEYLPYEATVNYLRLEGERLDRAFYVLSCLIDFNKPLKN